jgi:hypothetical protein
MATPIYPPTTTTNILVNTRLQPKIVYLPAVSTVGAGKLLFIKDICGNAANSSIYLSTTGLDSFDYKFRPSTVYALMSSNFQSVLLGSDGLLNWLILQNYNSNVLTRFDRYYTYPATPLVLLQASSYSGSGSWLDQSTNARNATLEAGTIAKNAEGNGIVLNGSTNWLFADVAAANAWTLSVWYKNTGSTVGSNPCIVTQIYVGNHINICLGYGANVGFSYHQGGVGWRQGSTINITNSSWQYYTGTWDGTTLTTYINGVLQGSTTPGGTASSSGQQYRIGRRWDSADYMTGQVGEVRIYNASITGAQVLIDFNFTKATYGVV